MRAYTSWFTLVKAPMLNQVGDIVNRVILCYAFNMVADS